MWDFSKLGGQADGSMRSRQMSTLHWPLGVDQFFSHSGDIAYLAKQLPIIDKIMAWIASHSDSDGLFQCSWKTDKGVQPAAPGIVGCSGPQGMDWVDWHISRAVGKTFIFESWYGWTLRRIASLHDEFSSSFGNATLVPIYRARAEKVVGSLRANYWGGDHWRTNEVKVLSDCCDAGVSDCCQTLCGEGKCAKGQLGSPGVWTDDQAWSLYLNVTEDPAHAAAVWEYLESTPRDGLKVTRMIQSLCDLVCVFQKIDLGRAFQR